MGKRQSMDSGGNDKINSTRYGDKEESATHVLSDRPPQAEAKQSPSKRQRRNQKKKEKNGPQSSPQKTIDKLKNENELLKQQNAELLQERQKLQQELDRSNSQQLQLKQELEETISKCSQLTSEKLLSTSKMIRDYDTNQNSPETLSERFHTELYSNKWCDAYEVMQNYGFIPDTEIVHLLRDICLECWTFCLIKTRRDLQQLLKILGICEFQCSPTEMFHKVPRDISCLFSKLPENVKKEFKTCKFKITPAILDQMHQEQISFSKENSTFLGVMDMSFNSEIKPYVTLCLELCLKMSLQEPTMYLHFKEEENANINLDRYDFYEDEGSRVQYVVWPVIFRQLDGQVLRKGIAKASA